MGASPPSHVIHSLGPAVALVPDPGIDLMAIKSPFVEDLSRGDFPLPSKRIERSLTDLQIGCELLYGHERSDHFGTSYLNRVDKRKERQKVYQPQIRHRWATAVRQSILSDTVTAWFPCGIPKHTYFLPPGPEKKVLPSLYPVNWRGNDGFWAKTAKKWQSPAKILTGHANHLGHSFMGPPWGCRIL
jgi:hypothetical protein